MTLVLHSCWHVVRCLSFLNEALQIQTRDDGIYRTSIASRGKNRLVFGGDAKKSLVPWFFDSQCIFLCIYVQKRAFCVNAKQRNAMC